MFCVLSPCDCFLHFTSSWCSSVLMTLHAKGIPLYLFLFLSFAFSLISQPGLTLSVSLNVIRNSGVDRGISSCLDNLTFPLTTESP
ncbi:unnamed protein product [Ixodes persulcatus]